MTRAKGRMPSERGLQLRREDADPVVGPRIVRRQHEGGLGEVRPACELLHLPRREPLCVEHHCYRIAGARPTAEDVYLSEPAGHTPSLAAPPRDVQFQRVDLVQSIVTRNRIRFCAHPTVAKIGCTPKRSRLTSGTPVPPAPRAGRWRRRPGTG